jgi:hypothetical protein
MDVERDSKGRYLMETHNSWDANRHNYIARDLVSCGNGYVIIGEHKIPVPYGYEQAHALELIKALAPIISMFHDAYGVIEDR